MQSGNMGRNPTVNRDGYGGSRKYWGTVQEVLLENRRVTKGGCWEWTGGTNGKQGYGQFRVRGKRVQVHRASYEAFIGPIPNGLFACHRCDNKLCFNPSHLFLGTPRDNAWDASVKGRLGRFKHPGNPALTVSERRAIYQQRTRIRYHTDPEYRESHRAYQRRRHGCKPWQPGSVGRPPMESYPKTQEAA